MRMRIVPLKSLMELEGFSESSVQGKLDSFRCSRDPDLELFLRRSAIPNEKRDLTRTYLAICDGMQIAGYFSLNLRCGRILPDCGLSKSRLKELNIQPDTNVAQMYLIAQVGRADDSPKGFGKLLMAEAVNVLRRARDLIGCHVVRIDCKPAPSLIAYYEHYGFQRIRSDSGEGLMMMVLLLRDRYLWEYSENSSESCSQPC